MEPCENYKPAKKYCDPSCETCQNYKPKQNHAEAASDDRLWKGLIRHRDIVDFGRDLPELFDYNELWDELCMRYGTTTVADLNKAMYHYNTGQ